MTYDEALADIRATAAKYDLGISTFCLVYLNCETVPEAVEKLLAYVKENP